MTNPYHKPAGFYPPQAPPTPIHKLSVGERFQLMFRGVSPTPNLLLINLKLGK